MVRCWQFRANTTTAVDKPTRSVPLLVAVEKGSDAVVRLLLSYGAEYGRKHSCAAPRTRSSTVTTGCLANAPAPHPETHGAHDLNRCNGAVILILKADALASEWM
eukprot:4884714-Pyramimonas_sp.AAC.4